MAQFRNDRSGETVSCELSKREILDRYLETAREDDWLWFWLAKHAPARCSL